jgi:hypothetical protein
VSDPEDPPKDPPPASIPDAPPSEATTIGSVDELYGATNPPPAATVEPIATATNDEPILPTTTDENALRDAVGAPIPSPRAKHQKAGDDDEPGKRSRRLFTAGAVTMLAALVIATFVMLGRANRDRFALTCTTDHITPEQGRAFPPWGTRPIGGAEWKPIALPANAECKPRETDSRAELEGWYLDLLIERASMALTTPNLLDAPASSGKPGASLLDNAADQLTQALLLSRSPDRRDQRKEVERLQGDVQYWRASLRLRDASAALLDASRQFDAAAQQRPRHVTDAAAWAHYVKTLADDLRTGPSGAAASGPTESLPPSPGDIDRPSAPMGTALPVDTPQETGSDTPSSVPDAGLPTGGVLL